MGVLEEGELGSFLSTAPNDHNDFSVDTLVALVCHVE